MAKKVTPFQQAVFDRCREIPPGKVATYGQIASAICRDGGTGSKARAVGQALKRNPFSFYECDDPEMQVPCHRVVSRAGKMTGYLGETGAESEKMTFKLSLLKQEGAVDSKGNIVCEFFSEWK